MKFFDPHALLCRHHQKLRGITLWTDLGVKENWPQFILITCQARQIPTVNYGHRMSSRMPSASIPEPLTGR